MGLGEAERRDVRHTRHWHGAIMAIALCLMSACTGEAPPRPPAAQPQLDADAWPRREVLDLAVRAYRCGAHEGLLQRPVLTVVDYSLPSYTPRLWVIDMEQRRVVHHDLVAHGEGSGGTMAVWFSNREGSHQSSLGLFRTEQPYSGRYGYSLRLTGLEPGINDRAYDRAIVVHGFAEIRRSVAARREMIARSYGCFAVPAETAEPIIDSIAGGGAVFSYFPDQQWLRDSHFLHCEAELADAADQAARR